MTEHMPPTDEGIILKQYQLAEMYRGTKPMPNSWNRNELFSAMLALNWVMTGKGLP
jgi:hypothetical protein